MVVIEGCEANCRLDDPGRGGGSGGGGGGGAWWWCMVVVHGGGGGGGGGIRCCLLGFLIADTMRQPLHSGFRACSSDSLLKGLTGPDNQDFRSYL